MIFVRKPATYVSGNLLSYNLATGRLSDSGSPTPAPFAVRLGTGTLTISGGHIATNAATHLFFKANIGGAFILDVPTGMTDGDVITWVFTQTGGGGAMTLATGFVLPDGATTPVLASGAGKVNIFAAKYDTTAGKMRVVNLESYAS